MDYELNLFSTTTVERTVNLPTRIRVYRERDKKLVGVWRWQHVMGDGVEQHRFAVEAILRRIEGDAHVEQALAIVAHAKPNGNGYVFAVRSLA
jgi:hypothetical protein